MFASCEQDSYEAESNMLSAEDLNIESRQFCPPGTIGVLNTTELNAYISERSQCPTEATCPGPSLCGEPVEICYPTGVPALGGCVSESFIDQWMTALSTYPVCNFPRSQGVCEPEITVDLENSTNENVVLCFSGWVWVCSPHEPGPSTDGCKGFSLQVSIGNHTASLNSNGDTDHVFFVSNTSSSPVDVFANGIYIGTVPPGVSMGLPFSSTDQVDISAGPLKCVLGSFLPLG